MKVKEYKSLVKRINELEADEGNIQREDVIGILTEYLDDLESELQAAAEKGRNA